jgi:hypothetical protein
MLINQGAGFVKVIRDSQAMTDMANDVSPHMSEAQKSAARRVIASFGQGDTLEDQVKDATELMMALGVHPTQDGELDYLFAPVSPLNANGPILA